MSNYNETEYQPEVITESEAYERFDAMLDDCCGDVEVAVYAYSTSAILKAVDLTAYREEFCGYIDSMREEFTVEDY